MNTDAELWDLQEQVLNSFEEAMDIAYREGVRDALDASGVIALAAPAEQGCDCNCKTTEPVYDYDPQYEPDFEALIDALDTLDEIGEYEPEVECPCGCGLTSEGVTSAFFPEDEEDPDEYTELTQRLEAVEEYVGLKYTG